MGVLANRAHLGHCCCGRFACIAIVVQTTKGPVTYRFCRLHREAALCPAGVALMLGDADSVELVAALAAGGPLMGPSG